MNRLRARKLDWAIGFALRDDLLEYRDVDWKRLRSQLINFVWSAGGRGSLPVEPFFGDSAHQTPARLRALQRELRAIFGQLADYPRRMTTVNLRGPIRVGSTDNRPSSPGASLAIVGGSTRDLVLLTLLNLIAESEKNPVGRCPAKRSSRVAGHIETASCGQIFARIGRRAFCSTRCRNRENTRKYRS